MNPANSHKNAFKIFFKYGYSHRLNFLYGFLGTLGVVFFRLAMPWPLRGIMEIVFPEKLTSTSMIQYVPNIGEPVIWFGSYYVILAIGIGLSEMLQRVNIKRFSAKTVHLMREDAVKSQTQKGERNFLSSGEIISRIIGDTARIKAGVSGILIHLSQNLILFLAVCSVMLYISPKLGFFFLFAGILVICIGFLTVKPLQKVTAKYRQKEGEYAAYIEDSFWDDTIDSKLDITNIESAKKDVRTTKIQTRSDLISHTILAITVGLALWLAVRDVNNGLIAPGEIFIFIAYILTIHRRLVQVGRQIARIGKVSANLNRITSMIEQPISETTLISSQLTRGLRLNKIKFSIEKKSLEINELVLLPQTKVLLRGKIHSGVSSLTKVLAGIERPKKGKIIWDNQEISQNNLRANISYLPENPRFPQAYLWQIIGFDKPDISNENQEILDKLGVWQLISRYESRLNTKLSSREMSRTEAKLLILSNIVMFSKKPVWVLEQPFEALSKQKSELAINEILRNAKGLLIMAFSRLSDIEKFDRIILLKNGKIKFDDTPLEYRKLMETKKSI